MPITRQTFETAVGPYLVTGTCVSLVGFAWRFWIGCILFVIDTVNFNCAEVSELSNSFPDEHEHFGRFTRSESGSNRSIQELADFFMYKQGIEFLSMHFCFVFKTSVAQYDASWQQDPGRVKMKLIELEKNCKLYCPIDILLKETFGKNGKNAFPSFFILTFQQQQDNYNKSISESNVVFPSHIRMVQICLLEFASHCTQNLQHPASISFFLK